MGAVNRESRHHTGKAIAMDDRLDVGAARRPQPLRAGSGSDRSPGIHARRALSQSLAEAPQKSRVLHFMCMKRTNLVLNEELLEEATRLSGERTYSRAVERALEEFVRRARARRILDLAGSGLWDGDLAIVREDRGVHRTRRRAKR